MKKNYSGQGLVEFALILPLFLMLMAGLLDGTRLLFTYNELQEAARAGARWGAVNVGRYPWGDSNTCGNYTPYTPPPTASCTITSTGGISSTIVGQINGKLIAVNQSLISINIISSTNAITQETGTLDGAYRISPVTVTVSYTFKPVLGFGHFGIKLVGKATADHE